MAKTHRIRIPRDTFWWRAAALIWAAITYPFYPFQDTVIYWKAPPDDVGTGHKNQGGKGNERKSA